MKRLTKTVTNLAATFLLASTALLTSAYASEKPALTICGTTWGKYGGDDLPGQGFVPDLVMRVFRHAGYEIKTELIPWSRCVELAKEMKYDLVSSGWRGPNFATHFDYLDVIAVDTINFITLDSSDVTDGSKESFYGKRVGFVREAGGIEALVQDEQILKTAVGQLDKLLPMLKHGRIDAIVSDPVNLSETVKASGFTGKLEAQIPPLRKNYNSPLIAKGHPHKEMIIRDFNAALKELKAQGLYDELIAIHDLQIQYED